MNSKPMLGKLLAWLLLFALVSSAAATEPLHLVVLGPEFEAFWRAAADRPFEEQVRAWDRYIEQPHREFYENFVWDKARTPNWEARKRRLLAKSFPQYAALYPAIRANFAQFPDTIAQQVARFRRSFPDAAFTGPIYAVPATSFNGKGGESGQSDGSGEMTLAFGMDVIAARRENVDVLYAHELFHIHHGKTAGIDEEVFAKEGRLTLPLWMEGFATYASGLLNPGATDGVLLMDESLGQMEAKERRWLAGEFLKVAEQPAVDDHGSPDFSKWFGAGAAPLRPGLPSRCGYWLGLAVVRELAKTHRLDEMVRWKAPEIHRRVVPLLEMMASTDAP